MNRQRMPMCCMLALAGLLSVAILGTDAQPAKGKREIWTDPADPTLPVDIAFQGEYTGDKIGAQVIALGDGFFQAIVYSGGLPGAGWDGKNRAIMDGKLQDQKIELSSISAKQKRQYLAKDPAKFSATAVFPPIGQRELKGHIIRPWTTKEAVPEKMTIDDDGAKITLNRLVRKSESLGKKPPEGAVVLFDGTDTNEWKGGRLDKMTNLLNTDGKDITTKRKFASYSAHVEFMIPFCPKDRGQGRGNSGFYQVDQYEVQILDSFGLEGKNNECGGVYERIDCKVNMCLPPLQWQTYDIDFTMAVRDDDKVAKKARITVRHNGVVVIDDAAIKSPTGGARNEPEGTPGVLRLQGHNNPLQFRNIWVVEKK